MILKNALVYTPRHTFEKGDLVDPGWPDRAYAQPQEGEEVVDADGLYALPGLVSIALPRCSGPRLLRCRRSRPAGHCRL